MIEIPIPLAAPPPAHNPSIEIISVPRWKSGKSEQERTLTEEDPGKTAFHHRWKACSWPGSLAEEKRIYLFDSFFAAGQPLEEWGENGGEESVASAPHLSYDARDHFPNREKEREEGGRGMVRANGKRRFSLPNRRGECFLEK